MVCNNKQTGQDNVNVLFRFVDLISIKLKFSVKIFNKYTRIAYLRCRRDPHEMLASVLPFITEIGGVKCFIRTLHLAGNDYMIFIT